VDFVVIRLPGYFVLVFDQDNGKWFWGSIVIRCIIFAYEEYPPRCDGPQLWLILSVSKKMRDGGPDRLPGRSHKSLVPKYDSNYT
jgi:hypothetical protein